MYVLNLIVLYLSIETVDIHASVSKRHVHGRKDFVHLHVDDKEYNIWEFNRYEHFGVTKTGYLCMTSCYGVCTSARNKIEACRVFYDKEIAPVYFTASARGISSVCRTRCGKFGSDYEWCSVEGDHEWDYCSSEIYTKKYKVHLTDSGYRCTTPCKCNTNGEYVCKNAWDQPETCNPYKVIDYVPTRTIYGEICVGPCYKKDYYYDQKFYTQCYDINKKMNYCAPPAYKFGNHTREMYNRLHFAYPKSSPWEYEIPY